MKAELEKITINMGSMDLAKIDLLVEQGYYQNRTDFIKKSIYLQLMHHDEEISKKIATIEKESSTLMGVVRISNSFLAELLRDFGHSNAKVTVFGICHIDQNITLKDFQDVISEIKVYGITKGNKEIKSVYDL